MKKADYQPLLVQHLLSRVVLPMDKPFVRMLDAGCGAGRHVKLMQDMGYQCEGIDHEISGIDFNKDPFPYRDSAFHLVWSKSVLEHLHGWENYISEIKRVLKVGGYLILLTPDFEVRHENFFNSCHHIRPYTVSSVRQMLTESGFKDVMVERFFHYPHYWKYKWVRMLGKVYLRVVPLWLGRALRVAPKLLNAQVLGVGRRF